MGLLRLVFLFWTLSAYFCAAILDILVVIFENGASFTYLIYSYCMVLEPELFETATILDFGLPFLIFWSPDIFSVSNLKLIKTATILSFGLPYRILGNPVTKYAVTTLTLTNHIVY